ncbi:hypothetical protein FOA52_011644 [Chlamydomonas sp. UWO 241]|nr:hypothetical protein FOA52_011644 [Chlamydomonas sp. UWO 241]
MGPSMSKKQPTVMAWATVVAGTSRGPVAVDIPRGQKPAYRPKTVKAMLLPGQKPALPVRQQSPDPEPAKEAAVVRGRYKKKFT